MTTWIIIIIVITITVIIVATIVNVVVVVAIIIQIRINRAWNNAGAIEKPMQNGWSNINLICFYGQWFGNATG
jgi:hypothetical protein